MSSTPPGCDPYDLMIAAILDSIVDGIPHEAIEDLCVDAQNAEQFYAGVQAAVELQDIWKDHHDQIQASKTLYLPPPSSSEERGSA